MVRRADVLSCRQVQGSVARVIGRLLPDFRSVCEADHGVAVLMQRPDVLGGADAQVRLLGVDQVKQHVFRPGCQGHVGRIDPEHREPQGIESIDEQLRPRIGRVVPQEQDVRHRGVLSDIGSCHIGQC